jgi:short-subunit dehydrogenase
MSITLKPLSEQVIVITGASSGIGLATVEAAARERAKLVLVARSELTLKDNAGVSIYGRLDQIDLEDARRMFDVDFWGVAYGSLVALRHLRQSGGAIINIGSEVSEAAIPLQGFYVAAKHAVKGFTEVLRIEAQELDQAPVSITLVEPGATDTPFPENARNFMDSEPQLPTPQSDPADVAEAILKAATKPTRVVRVGASALMNTTMARLAPGLAEKMAAKQEAKQQRDEPPRNPQGTLYEPSESGRLRGR